VTRWRHFIFFRFYFYDKWLTLLTLISAVLHLTVSLACDLFRTACWFDKVSVINTAYVAGWQQFGVNISQCVDYRAFDASGLVLYYVNELSVRLVICGAVMSRINDDVTAANRYLLLCLYFGLLPVCFIPYLNTLLIAYRYIHHISSTSRLVFSVSIDFDSSE